VSYRNELDAAHARSQALERELAEARDKIEVLERSPGQALAKLESSELLVRTDASGPVARRWLGAPHRLELSRTLAGEVPEAGYVELIELIRQRLNQVGATTVLPGSLAWTAALGHNSTGPHVSVYVTARRGTTSIRIEEKLGNLAGGIYGGLGGVGMGAGIIVPIAAATITPLLLPVAIPLWLGGIYWGCRRIYRGVARKRAVRLEKLLEELSTIAETQIAEAAADAAAEAAAEADGS
jgi:hypothetical protein